MIFSHGLGAHSAFYTATYHTLAAHGYLVIAINHQDESCLYTENKDGADIPFTQKDFYDYPFRQKQIMIRSEEVLLTIDALRKLSPELHFKIFGGSAPNAKIDMSELVLAGHSFGAGTMIAVDSKLKTSEQPRALLLMDPWVFAIHERVMEGEISVKCPVQMIHTENFHDHVDKKPFDSWGCVQKILKEGRC